MNANQEAKLKMYRAVESYCAANSAIINTNIAFKNAFTEFQAKIAAINSTAQQDASVITGIAADKNVLKQKLCEKTADTAGIIYAYAATVGNNTLKDEVNFSYSSLMKMREDSLAMRCQNIHDAGAANLAALQDYGITQGALDTLQDAIAEYSAETPKPRTAITERKTTTANLAALFEQTDEILKDRMDRLALAFKTSQPDFYKTYEATRRMVKPPVTHTQIKGKVTGKTDAKPVPNAQVKITPNAPNGSGAEPQTAATDAAGEYCLKPVIHGLYDITVTANGFQNFQLDNFDAKLGEINDLDVELVK